MFKIIQRLTLKTGEYKFLNCDKHLNCISLTPSICQSCWLSLRGSHVGKELNLLLGTIGKGMKCKMECIFKPQSNISVVPLKV